MNKFWFRRLRLVVLFALLGTLAQALSQEEYACPFERSDSELGYEQRSRYLCDGLIEKNRSQPDIELIGFRVVGSSLDTQSGDLLITSPFNGRPLRVEAASRRPELLYRMDGLLVGDEPLRWPTGDETPFRGLKLSIADVSLLAWHGEARRIYVPLGSRVPDPSMRFEFLARSAVDLNPAMYRFLGGSKPSEWRELPLIFARTPFTVPADIPEGTLEIRGMISENQATEIFSFRFETQ